MALADMYKQNNVTYYESGHVMSGVFSDTIENLMADGMIDYSIFLNTGSTWTMKNTGTIGNHFAWYADWVGGVLAVRKGPDVIPITYLGSAVLSKNITCVVANLSAKQADGAGWANFKTGRFMIDAIQYTQGRAAQYVSFNYGAYSSQKYGFNSCFIESTAGYATSNTAHNYTGINDYTTLTGDNAKRIVYSNYQVMLTKYNPYMADSDNIDKYNVGYIWDFFNIGGEIVCVRDILRMPNSAHWQSWAYYHDVTDKYVTIGGFGGNVVAGSQGALPESDNVKGIFSYNNSGTSANWFTTKNAVDYKTNSLGLRWCVGNNTISTAKQWRDNVRLGVMAASGIITHDQWLIGESAIQASDNPNKNTDYDHIPSHGGGGGGGGDDDNDDAISTAGAPFAAGLCRYYALTAGSELLEHISEALGTWDIENTHKDLYKNLVSCKLVKPPAAIPTTGSEPFTIYGVKPQYQGADITLPVVSGNPDASFGPYTIDRKFGDFRDYAPFTRVSIYLPYCGWCDLPSHVVGKQISVQYFTDIIAATCKAVVFCLSGAGSNIIAEAAGVIGLDIPFVADNVGAKMQAVTAGMIAALGGGIQLGAGIGTMVSTKSGSGAKAALSGASQYLSGYSQMAMAFNENTTEISGKNGDGCCLAGATNIIIKIVRPKKGAYTDAPYVPPGYGHNIGFVSQKQVKVSSVSGLLIADNVDTSGISGATEAERAEIKRVLETGLIVNAAPE